MCGLSASLGLHVCMYVCMAVCWHIRMSMSMESGGGDSCDQGRGDALTEWRLPPLNFTLGWFTKRCAPLEWLLPPLKFILLDRHFPLPNVALAWLMTGMQKNNISRY